MAENAKQCRKTRNTVERRTVRAGISRKDGVFIPDCSEYLPDPTKIAGTGSRIPVTGFLAARKFRLSKLTCACPRLVSTSAAYGREGHWFRMSQRSKLLPRRFCSPQAQRFCGSSRRASSGWAGRRTRATLSMKFFSTRLLLDCSDRYGSAVFDGGYLQSLNAACCPWHY